MKLQSWLKEQEWTASDLADRIKVSPSTVTRLLRGELEPSLGLAHKIVTATGKAVRYEDLLA